MASVIRISEARNVMFSYLVDDGIDFKRRAVTEADIQGAEQDLGVSFPADFRAFLMTHDGPTPNRAYFPVEGSKWCGPIFAFISTWRPVGRGEIGRSPCIEHLTQYHRESDKLSKQYIVIAQMQTHPNTLLLSTSGDDCGAVYAWKPSEKRFRPDQLLFAAESFDAFLQLLSERPADLLAQPGGQPEGRPGADEYEGPEARRWLQRNRNPAALGANHFGGTDAARHFVEELYALGATKVLVPENSIQKDDDDGPYADALVVELPADDVKRAALCDRCEQELDLAEQFDAADPNPIYLWWD